MGFRLRRPLIPLQDGCSLESKQSIMVDIVMETTDASIKFWLESTDLHLSLQTQKEFILNQEIEKIRESNILVLFTN